MPIVLSKPSINGSEDISGTEKLMMSKLQGIEIIARPGCTRSAEIIHVEAIDPPNHSRLEQFLICQEFRHQKHLWMPAGNCGCCLQQLA